MMIHSYVRKMVSWYEWLLHDALVYKFIIFIITLLIFYSIKKYITKIIVKIFKFFKLDHEKSMLIMEKMLPSFILLVGLDVAVERVMFPGKIGFVIENICRTGLLAYFFNILLHLIPVLIRLFVNSQSVAIEWVIKLFRGFVIFVCVTSILESWGIKVAPIITGFGLFGAAVAFAAKDFFENIISGAILISENKFKHGDHIKVDDEIEGIVDVIRLRSTKIIRLDLVPIYVPNSKLAGNSVINYSMRDNREIYWTIGLTYTTKLKDIKKIRDQIAEYIENNDDFINNKGLRDCIHVSELAGSSINLLLICYTKTNKWEEWLVVREQLVYKVLEIVEKNNSSLAFSSKSIYIESMPVLNTK